MMLWLIMEEDVSKHLGLGRSGLLVTNIRRRHIPNIPQQLKDVPDVALLFIFIQGIDDDQQSRQQRASLPL